MALPATAPTNIWMIPEIILTESYSFEDQTLNVIVLGTIKSDYDISFKVNNMVVIGSIISKSNVTILAKQSFFNSGTISAVEGSISIRGEEDAYNGLTATAIEKIRALGIDLSSTPNNMLSIRLPRMLKQ